MDETMDDTMAQPIGETTGETKSDRWYYDLSFDVYDSVLATRGGHTIRLLSTLAPCQAGSPLLRNASLSAVFSAALS